MQPTNPHTLLPLAVKLRHLRRLRRLRRSSRKAMAVLVTPRVDSHPRQRRMQSLRLLVRRLRLRERRGYPQQRPSRRPRKS